MVVDQMLELRVLSYNHMNMLVVYRSALINSPLFYKRPLGISEAFFSAEQQLLYPVVPRYTVKESVTIHYFLGVGYTGQTQTIKGHK